MSAALALPASPRKLRRTMKRLLTGLVLVLLSIPALRADNALFARSNLVAWCNEPFDAKKRGPEERAAMLQQLGLRRLADGFGSTAALRASE